MSVNFYSFYHYYPKWDKVPYHAGCAGNQMSKVTDDDEEIAYRILEVVDKLEEAYSSKRSVHEYLGELLAFKFGVQTICELDEHDLIEFKEEFDAALKNPRMTNKTNRSPSQIFHELLAQKYGAQSIYELEPEALKELEKDADDLADIFGAAIIRPS